MPIVRTKHSFDSAFTQIPNAWLRDPRLTLRGKGLLAQLMSHAPGWRVSLRSLAADNNCGLDAIRAAMNELLDAGYLVRSEDRERNDKGQLADFTYYTQDPNTLGQPTSEKPTLDFPTLGNPTPKNTSSKEYKETKEILPQAALEEAFTEFWEAYPRKVEKIAAKRAFARAAKEVEPCELVEGARRLAADPNLPPKQFVPYPASWLNAGGWESEPFPERQRTPEEQAAYDQAQREQRWERERVERERAAEERRAEAEATAAALAANPIPRCEHDRIVYACRECSKVRAIN